MCLQIGKKEVIHVPESGLAPYQIISWDIKAPEIASLSPRGFPCEVLALKAGETQITATTEARMGSPSLPRVGLPWCRKISVLHAFLTKVLLKAAVAVAAMPDLPGC